MDLGLLRMKNLMEALGHPEKNIPIIHVAGTNGKGSTCTFLASILKRAGLLTGLFQSPAVFDPMEIIQINEKNISKEDYQALYEEITLAAESLSAGEMSTPTIFEVQTAMAFLYFSRSGCDVAVIETGLGGDLDATNVSDAAIGTVFTPISLDHTALLGDTLESIAEHKSGIMRAGTPVFTVRQPEEVEQVLYKRAVFLDCPYFKAHKPLFAKMGDDGHFLVSFEGFPTCRLGLAGSFQSENAALAVTVLCTLRKRGLPLFGTISDMDWERAIVLGLSKAKLSGRMECIGHDPDVLLDGAHNPQAALKLSEALEKRYPNTPRIYILGAFSDKNYKEVARCVIKDEIFVAAIDAPTKRGESAGQLVKSLKDIGCEAEAYPDAYHALLESFLRARDYFNNEGVMPVIICFGSFSWLSEAKNAYKLLALENKQDLENHKNTEKS